MKLCKNCGHWEFAGERGSWGQCTEGLKDGDSGENRPFNDGADEDCGSWVGRCCECGDPAYTELYIREDGRAPISAYYCDRCAEELGVWP